MLNHSISAPTCPLPSCSLSPSGGEGLSPSEARIQEAFRCSNPSLPPMDASSGRPSQRRQLQGPRPPRLNVSKESHKIKKPPAGPSQAQGHQHHRPAQQQAAAGAAPRAPVIIYDASPKVIHTKPSEFMALVQRLTGPGSGGPGPAQAQAQLEDPLPPQFLPQELLLSPTAALSPAARLAAIERSVRPMPPAPAPYIEIADDADDGLAGILGPVRTGILSPMPSSLPPAVSSGLFSPLPFDPNCISWLNDLSPILAAASAAAGGSNGSRLGFDPFVPSPRNLLATPTLPSPATCAELFSFFQDP